MIVKKIYPLAYKNKRGKVNSLIEIWMERLGNAQIGHYHQSEKLYFRANFSGCSLIVSSTVVTAMLFMEPSGFSRYLLISMSIVSASLSGIVSFARFAEKAEQHRSAGGSYGKLRRQLEKLNTSKENLSNTELDKQLKILRIEWEYISQSAPLTSYSSLQKIKKLKLTK
ncbi:SLATT domain-containing protein [Enterovibrio baiacu]|uniref:SLATT domain-containing protein n=1 Tax=Enterovibrio baiacu TaxID=2491023 RepID=UPI00101208B6|nr:SLATT domain-containing protein [Enterovibrio baiacu]MBE1276336.1 SLATT domain-containing protein [Enterovibrio baiacu]